MGLSEEALSRTNRSCLLSRCARRPCPPVRQDLKLGELLDTPPPGLDEAIAITKARAASARPVCFTTCAQRNEPPSLLGD